jgi:hypothetical protein
VKSYARLKALENRVLFLEDSGFLEYLESKSKSKAENKYENSNTKYGQNVERQENPSSPPFNSPPQPDPNKRIAELVATLQKKSTETNK